MESGKISYPGVAAAVAGVVGLLGVYSDWWETSEAVYNGTADVSGSLALAMSIAVFVFGGAHILMSDGEIRRAMGALFTLCSFVLAVAALWGSTRADEVAAGAITQTGLWVSAMAGAIGIAAGVLVFGSPSAGGSSSGGDAPADSDSGSTG